MYDGQHNSEASDGSMCVTAQISSLAFSCCPPTGGNFCFGSFLEQGELACLRNGFVVTALALALVFSALDVFRGQLYDFSVAA